MPSKFSIYKKYLKRHLVGMKWEKHYTLEWLNEHIYLVHSFHDSGCPSFEAALIINKYLKEN